MTWEMIRELSLIDNVKIGSHSNIHNNLKLFKDEDLINDLMSSKIKTEEKQLKSIIFSNFMGQI